MYVDYSTVKSEGTSRLRSPAFPHPNESPTQNATSLPSRSGVRITCFLHIIPLSTDYFKTEDTSSLTRTG